MESLFMKNLPREVRGAMTILLTFFMGIAALAYNSTAGPVFDSLGPASPFIIISIFDVVLCLFAVGLAISGHLNYSDSSSPSGLNSDNNG